MYERLLRRPLAAGKRSILVLGPRQVGKSTLLRGLGPDLVVNLASPTEYRTYVTRPEQFEQELQAVASNVRAVLIDEVQRVPALLDAVQAVLDARPGRFRFLLSGSSARKLRRGQANLLPGRVHVHGLHPLLEAELEDDFDLDRVLAHGTLPGIYAEKDAAVRAQDLRSYVDVYLKEEIQAEALVRDVGGYARLLELAAASSGRILNVNALCRDAGIGYETARRYIQILEDTLVAFSVPAWSGSERSGLVSHPRLFFFDLGVRNAILRRPLDRPLEDERGLLLEHLVAYEIQRRTGTLWPEARLFYFRTRHGLEVDFLVEVGREVWGIEVKASTRVDTSATRGLAALAERGIKKLTRRILVFLGARRQHWNGIEALPLREFLRELPR